MREIKGPIEELLNKENYENTNTQDYIKATITNEEILYNPIGQIRKVYPNILSLELKNSKTVLFNRELERIEKLKEKDALELFDDFYEYQFNNPMNQEQKAIIQEIFNNIKEGEE